MGGNDVLSRLGMFGKIRNLFSALLIAGTLMGTDANASAEIIFVNVNSLNTVQDGNSWETAFTSLQAGLVKAATLESSNIWVAQGAYFPTQIYSPNGVPGGASGDDSPNLATFDLPNNVSIFGGFNGTETAFCQRDPEKFHTVLTGGGTSWHVVTLGNDIAQTGVTAVLDGLIIAEGNAQGPEGPATFLVPFAFGHSYGGGVYMAFGSNIHVNNVSFINNVAAVEGGGFFSISSTVLITKSRFIGNTAGLEGGGVEILNTFETSPHVSTIQSTLFERNSAVIFGGAMVAEGTLQNPKSFAQVKNCVFKNNFSQVGGAIAIDSIKVKVLNSSFDTNIASVAGGALSTSNIVNTFSTALHGTPFTPFTTTIIKCKFSNNVAQGNLALHDVILGGTAAGVDFPLGGGAIAVYINGFLNVDRSKFSRNIAQNSNGGAILNGRSAGENILFTGADGFIVQTNVTNSSFVGNRAPTGNGGAIASLPSTFAFATPLPITVGSTTLSVKGSKFKSNVAGVDGGGIYLNFSTATLANNCFSHNKAALGQGIFAIDSIINGDSASPVILPASSSSKKSMCGR